MDLQEWKEKVEGCADVYRTLFDGYEAVIPERGLLAGFHAPAPAAGKPAKRNPDLWKVFDVDNMHYPMGDAYLKYGIGGILRMTEDPAGGADAGNEAGECARRAVRQETPAETEESIYRRGIHEVYLAVRDFIGRHAQAAERLLREAEETRTAEGTASGDLEREGAGKKGANPEEPGDRADECARLSRIAHTCRKLMTDPPEGFQEALQLFWFLYILRSPFGGCIGRLDQKLYPFCRADLERGTWNREEALESIVLFYENLNRMSRGDTLRNLMLSGQNEKGEDETNELTWLFLEAYERTPDAEPHLNVRLHARSPEQLRERCVRMLASGKGQPTVYFDENLLPAMEAAGIPREAACGYANDGCTETVYDGCSGIVFWQHEMVKTVELTMFNGRENPSVHPVRMKKNRKNAPEFEAKTGLTMGFCSGELSEMRTFDDFLSAFYAQLHFQIERWLARIGERIREDETVSLTSPLVGGTFEKCLLTGRDPLRGGGFEVENYQLLSGTVTTAADCLRAVEYGVFERGYCSLTQLRDAMAVNFEGWEPLRQRLLHAPKYGNGDMRTDELAAQISERFLDQVNAWRSESGKRVRPGLYNIDFKIFANVTGATPDGRRFRDPIGEHCCPTPGAAVCGPTAIVESASRLPMAKGYASSVLHLSLDGSAFVMGADRERIIRTLMEASRAAGIPVWNLTLYDRQELRDAQREPEKHQDLIVRVWGFNARFVELDEELQEHIIARIS